VIPQTALTRHCKGTKNSLNYVVKGLNIKDYLSLFTKMSFCCRFNRKSVVVECVDTPRIWIIEKCNYLKSVIYFNSCYNRQLNI